MSLKGAKVEKFRQRLLAKRKELLSGVRGSNVGSIEMHSDEIQDIADQASSAYTKEFLLSIGDTERRMLKQVDEALNKIRQDTYGLCETCGEMISERRLEALPFARLCIACQEEEERAKARRSDRRLAPATRTLSPPAPPLDLPGLLYRPRGESAEAHARTGRSRVMRLDGLLSWASSSRIPQAIAASIRTGDGLGRPFTSLPLYVRCLLSASSIGVLLSLRTSRFPRSRTGLTPAATASQDRLAEGQRWLRNVAAHPAARTGMLLGRRRTLGALAGSASSGRERRSPRRRAPSRGRGATAASAGAPTSRQGDCMSVGGWGAAAEAYDAGGRSSTPRPGVGAPEPAGQGSPPVRAGQ